MLEHLSPARVSPASERPKTARARQEARKEPSFEVQAGIEWLQQRFPLLQQVDFELVDEDYFEGGAGGQLRMPVPEDGIERPSVVLTKGDAPSFEALKQTRSILPPRIRTAG